MKKLLVFLFVLCLFTSLSAMVSMSGFSAFVESGHESFDSEERHESSKGTALGFTPSAKAKNAPDIVAVEDFSKIKNLNTTSKIEIPENFESFTPAKKIESANEPMVLVSEKMGEEGTIVGAVKRIDVEIVSYAEKQTLRESEINEVVIAYEDLKKAEDYTEVIPDLDQFLKDNYSGNLAATQIFFIRPAKEVAEFININEFLNLRILFKKSLLLGENSPIIAVKVSATGEWMVIDPATILQDWYEEGTFSVDFHHFGTVVFLEPKVK